MLRGENIDFSYSKDKDFYKKFKYRYSKREK